MIYIMRFRPFQIKDVAVARLIKPFATSKASVRSKETFKSYMDTFDKFGLVTDLPEEKEFWFLKELVRTNPEYSRSFDHFLINPPNNLLPSELYEELNKRSEIIPTIAAVHMVDGKIKGIKKITYQGELFELLSYSYSKGWVNNKDAEKLLGIKKGSASNV